MKKETITFKNGKYVGEVKNGKRIARWDIVEKKWYKV